MVKVLRQYFIRGRVASGATWDPVVGGGTSYSIKEQFICATTASDAKKIFKEAFHR